MNQPVDEVALARIEKLNSVVGRVEVLLEEDKVEKMTEREFVTNYLLTLHQWLRNDPNEEKVNIGIWLEKAKITALQEVAIINEQGVELFRVPSVIQQVDKVLPSDVISNLGEYAYRANELDKHFPGRGREFLNRHVTQHVLEHPQLERRARWDAIFTRYGLEPVFNVDLPQNGNASNTNPIEEFDEFEIP